MYLSIYLYINRIPFYIPTNSTLLNHTLDIIKLILTYRILLTYTHVLNLFFFFFFWFYRSGEQCSIVNTASFVCILGAATPQLAYTASKGAVLAMTRELAVIHARENIRVNSLCPGPLNTELLQKFLDTQEKKHRRLVHVPLGRFGEG